MRFSSCYLPRRRCCLGKPSVGSPHGARYDQVLQGDGLKTISHLLQLLCGDANGTVDWNARTGKECGEQIALIAFGIGQETSRVDGAAALASDDEGKALAGVLVPILKAGA